MTIIMGYTVGIVPILMGDILVTREGASDSEFNRLPFGQMDDEAAAHVSMLRQKVNIINDNVILAWAGSLLQARTAFRHIADTLERSPGTIPDMGAVIRAIPEADRNELSLIGFIRGDKTTRFFSHETKPIRVGALGNAVIAGSGAGYVGRLVGHLEYHHRANQAQDTIPDEDAAILYAMWIAAEAAGLEHASGENLIDRWGGVIEVASFARGRAKKLSDALYAFWEFQTERGGRLKLLPKFVKVEYHGDLLVVFLLSGRGRSREKLTFEVNVWGIPPLISRYQVGTVVHVPRPTFEHDYLCSQVALKTGTTVHEVNSTVLPSRSNPLIRFVQRGRHTAVEVDPWYEAQVKTLARKMRRAKTKTR